MAVTNFSPLLGLALPTTGDLSGTWGTTVNDAITGLIDSAVAGTTTLSADADVTLSTTNGAANQARNAVILWTASNGGTTRNITAPAQSKAYVVINAGTGSIVIRGSGPTTGVTVASGVKTLVAWNGSDFVKIASSLVSLTSDVTGILPVANGGTATATPALVAGSNVTITGTWPNQTINAAAPGTGTVTAVTASAPLASSGGTTPNLSFTGTLPVANGGTGATTLTANNVLLGNGTSALQVVAPGTNGNVLTSNGTTWTSAAVAATLSGVTNSGSPFETALGYQAGNVTTGLNNTWIGYQAGLLTTSGTNNTAVGTTALTSNTTGSSNTAIGNRALIANTTGQSNTAIGDFTLNANTTGGFNTGVGPDALTLNTTGINNTATGYRALRVNTTGTNNTAVGYQTLDANTTGNYNAALGAGALGANTTGTDNTAIGYNALRVNDTGLYNTAVGTESMNGHTTGNENVAIGRISLYANTTGSSNTAVGATALMSNTTASNNTAVGYQALDASTGADNTAVGKDALGAVTTGTQNTALGSSAGLSGTNNLTTGSNNILIGYNAAASSATVSNEITLGNSSVTKLRVPGLSVDWAVNDVPFRNIPQNSQSAAYTLVASDAGKHIFHPVGDNNARTFTIPANSSVAYPIGTAITFINMAVANVTIAITTDTLTLSPAGTTGSRTLATNGSATCIKITSTEWLISGSGLT